jgi:hypothetical protein
MAYSNIQPIASQNAARYKYYTVDIVSNTIIGEIPFEDVSYERSLKAAGAFSGKITTSQQTDGLDLYNSTMPGKTALYVVRNNECVWGGIIWGRTYDMLGRSLSVSAAEFTSYLSHRLIWKTHSFSYEANLSAPTGTADIFKVELTSTIMQKALTVADDNLVNTQVYISFTDNASMGKNGYYDVVGTETTGVSFDPGVKAFFVKIPNFKFPTDSKGTQTKSFYSVSVTSRADTYEYVRTLISEAFKDFVDIDFANEIIEPGVRVPITIATKQLTTANTTYGVATFTTTADHGLIVGERVKVVNVDTLLDGPQTVSEVPSKRSFKAILDNPKGSYDQSTPLVLANIDTTAVVPARSLISRRRKVLNDTKTIKSVSRVGGVVTLTMDTTPIFVVGEQIIVVVPDTDLWKKNIKGKSTKMFDYAEAEAVIITGVDKVKKTITYKENLTLYNETIYNITATVPPADKSKTYIKKSTPSPQLRLFPAESIGVNIGDSIKVSGVDDHGWTQPYYNGHATISDTSAGIPNTITSYQLSNSLDETFGVLKVFFANLPDTNEAPGISTIDDQTDVLITGLDERFDNQVWQTSGGTLFDPLAGVSGLWKVEFIVPYLSEDLTIISAPAGATATVSGGLWFQYAPVWENARTTLPEPGAENSITHVKYTKPSGSGTYGILTVWLGGESIYNTGDSFDLVFTDKDMASKFDGGRMAVSSNPEDGILSFKIKNTTAISSNAPTVKTAKTGKITRTMTKMVPEIIEAFQITHIGTDGAGNVATAHTAIPHSLDVGDYVVLSIPQESYSKLSNNGEPIKIVAVPDSNRFQFLTEEKLVSQKVSNITTVATSTDGKLMTLTTGGVANVTSGARTANIVSIYNGGAGSTTGLYLPMITLDANHSSAPGESVTISGLPAATFGSVSGGTSLTTKSINYIKNESKIGTDGSLIRVLRIQFSSSHGFSQDKLQSYPKVTVSGLPSSVTPQYYDTQSYPPILRTGVVVTYLNNVILKRRITSNKAIFTTWGRHGLVVGDSVKLSGFKSTKDKFLNGTRTVTAVTLETFTVNYTASNLAEAACSADASTVRNTTIRKNLSVYNGTYPIESIPNSTTIVIAVPDKELDVVKTSTNESINTWWTDVDIAGTVTFPATSGSAPKLTPDLSLINGQTTVWDIGGALYPTKFFLNIPALDTKQEIITNASATPGVATFAGRVVTIANNTPHGLSVGDHVSVSGIGGFYSTLYGTYIPLGLVNGKHRIVSKTNTTITINSPLYIDANGYQTYFVNKTLSSDEINSAVLNKEFNVEGAVAYKDYRRTSPGTVKKISNIVRSADGAYATVTSPGHGLSDAELVYINVYSSTGAVFNQMNAVNVIGNVTADTFTYNFNMQDSIDRISVKASGIVILYTPANSAHRFSTGDQITLSEFYKQDNSAITALNGNTFTIKSVSGNQITISGVVGLTPANFKSPYTLKSWGSIDFAVGGITSVSAQNGSVIIAPTVSKEPVVYRNTYGEFPENADMGGMEFSTSNYSERPPQASQPIRGSQLVNLGGHLEQYSGSINGFDYRIDCSLETDSVTGTYKFKRTFVLVPIYPESLTTYLKKLNYQRQDPITLEIDYALAPGQVADPVAFGADKLVFEYPGNISNVSVSENAESSATRVFITRGGSDGGSGGESLYSAASATDLLAAGWPLLDRSETQSWPVQTSTGAINTDNWGNYDAELDFYKTAKRFLYESKPPIGDFTISVNGSMNPTVGTFNPGDWCSLNINDAFVKSRLASALELRKNVIVRKIDAIRVSVPNNPAFPEQVDLTLVTDWQVDKVGE